MRLAAVRTSVPLASVRHYVYLLVTVVVALFLLASVAMLLARDSAINANTASKELESARADYVAQAAMQHALWRSGNNACMGDATVSETSLGSDSYTATISGAAAGTSYTLSVDQDAWIRSDNPGQNNGDANDLHTRFENGEIEQPLVRFDLSPLPADAQVYSASVWFYVEAGKEHPEGPVTLHSVTANWVEGDVDWDSFNGSYDSAPIGMIPAQDTGAVWVRVNVTGQVQAWINGQPNYGILLNSVAEGVHAEYTSSEGSASEHPRLEVVVGNGPASPVAIEATGTTANGLSRTLQRNTVTALQPGTTLVLQPDAAAGSDAYISEANPTTGYGDADEAWVANGSSFSLTLLKFDLGGIPKGASIRNARLSLHHRNGNDADVPVSVHRVTRSWSEGSVTWEKRYSSSDWDSPGGDYDGSAIATTGVGPGTNTRYEWDVTALVQQWADEVYSNNGFALRTAAAGISGERFDTSDHADTSRHPQLTVTYACACGTPCMAPRGSGRIAMVVNYPGLSPGPADQRKKELFESWGYDVDAYDDNFLWLTNFNDYDVAYVSETADDNAIGTQLNNLNIGVVNEHGGMNDELGFASGDSSNWPVGNEIAIDDTGHYITLPFPAGALDIYDAAMGGLAMDGTPAAGLQNLASWSSGATISLLDVNAINAGGDPSPGRRVMLPFGRDAEMDWTRVSNNGRLILQRAIQWATGNAGPSAATPTLWLSTIGDVSNSNAPGLDDWSEGTLLEFGNPGLLLEPDTTAGTFTAMFDLDDFGDGNVDIDAIHYVGSNITVGSATTFDLLEGDVLLSTTVSETLTGTNSISVSDEDVFVFRPDMQGDYSNGSFHFLIDGSQMFEGTFEASNTEDLDVIGLSLVERDTTVGDRVIARGTFLVPWSVYFDLYEFAPTGVGLNTTAGTFSPLIDGSDISLGSTTRGVDLVEEDLTLGAQLIPRGALVMTLNSDDSSVGNNGIHTDSVDAFYLTVTQTGADTVADATLLFEGADVNLDTSNERLHALALKVPVSGGGGCVGTYRDEFAGVSFANSDGTLSWSGDWADLDSSGSGPTAGKVLVTGNELRLNGTPVGDDPSVARQADLSASPTATLSFDYRTGSGVEVGEDSVVVEISDDGGSSWTVLEDFVNEGGSAAGSRSFDVSAYAAVDTQVRFRVNAAYGGPDEYFFVDNVRVSSGECAETEPSTGPVAHWMLDETGGSTAVDSIGGHDGTLGNEPSWSTGQLDGALHFDGDDDYVDLTSDAELDDVFDGGATVMAWIYPTGWGENGFGRVFDKSSSASSTGDGWVVRMNVDNSGVINFGQGFSGGRGWWRTPDGSIGLNAWQHIAIAYDSSSTANDPQFYLNGIPLTLIEIDSPSGSFRSDASINLRLGNHAGGATHTFAGKIDDVRIYGDMLDAGEIAALAAAGAGLPIAHWKLDETSGTTAVDSVGGHDGTLTNGPAWVAGQIGGALDFDGSNDLVSVPHQAIFTQIPMTVSAWFKLDTLPTTRSEHGTIIDKRHTVDPYASWTLYVNETLGDKIRFQIRDSSETGYWLDSAASAVTNTWYHVVGTIDESYNAKLYVNGALEPDDDNIGSLFSSNDEIRIGAGWSGGNRLDGVVDDVRYYDRALSAAEISGLYTAGTGGGGGGGGGGGCSGTFRDEFNARVYSNSDGTLSWATNWQETGETTNPTSGDIRINSDAGNYQLQVRDDGQTVMREADLGDAGSATLSFDYRRQNLNGSNDYVAVEVSYDGGSNWDELDRFTGTATDSSYLPYSRALDSNSLSSNTRIRFRTPNSGMSNSNMVWFDNIQIECSP